MSPPGAGAPTVPDDARVATAVLMRVGEAGTPLAAHVRRHGPVATLADIASGASIPGVDVAPLRARLREADGERELAAAQRCGARLVCPGDEEWPPALDDLARVDADCIGLWVRGPHRLDQSVERAVAIVGTRTPTAYGEHVAGELAAGLAERMWTVVSGAAFGVDAAAHRAALSASGLTIAVLACGVDIAYPAAHARLLARLADEGLVVSEHPFAAAPQRHRFLVRNRIIAALAAGTVMVEAAARSGARSTLNHAHSLLRHAMVVPGPVTSTTSQGCHAALREVVGAVLVTRVAEIVEQCGSVGELADPLHGPVRARDRLGPVVRRVFEAVPVRKPVAATRIALTGCVTAEVADAALAALAALGLVEQVGTGWRMTDMARAERRSLAAEAGAGEMLPFGWG